MWEIDILIKTSIALLIQSPIASDEKRNLIWNLEQLPAHYQFDAGGYELTETDPTFKYTRLSLFQLGESTSEHATKSSATHLIYDWSAFLLNFWEPYQFANGAQPEQLKEKLQPLKERYHLHDFSAYKPIHLTLTVHTDGYEHLSDTQNSLVKWFVTPER